jgi:hypothetical protein
VAERKTPQKSKAANVVGAGAAGGGIGTIIAAVANGMTDGTYKSVLTLSAPLITVGISGLWLFLKTVYIDPFANRRKHAAADTAMDKIIADARANAVRVLNDPNSSDQHKREVQKILEDLQKLRMKKISERMEVITAD